MKVKSSVVVIVFILFMFFSSVACAPGMAWAG